MKKKILIYSVLPCVILCHPVSTGVAQCHPVSPGIISEISDIIVIHCHLVSSSVIWCHPVTSGVILCHHLSKVSHPTHKITRACVTLLFSQLRATQEVAEEGIQRRRTVKGGGQRLPNTWPMQWASFLERYNCPRRPRCQVTGSGEYLSGQPLLSCHHLPFTSQVSS